MDLSTLKDALSHYGGAMPIDPREAVYVHTDENGHQKAIMWREVADSALVYIEVMEALCEAAKQEPMGRFWMSLQVRLADAEKSVAELQKRNDRQSKLLQEKDKELDQWKARGM